MNRRLGGRRYRCHWNRSARKEIFTMCERDMGMRQAYSALRGHDPQGRTTRDVDVTMPMTRRLPAWTSPPSPLPPPSSFQVTCTWRMPHRICTCVCIHNTKCKRQPGALHTYPRTKLDRRLGGAVNAATSMNYSRNVDTTVKVKPHGRRIEANSKWKLRK